MLWFLGIVFFLFVLSVSVALHEGGHLLAAKSVGVLVPKYFVGFGPTLWSTKRGETEYGVKALPLGGFISVEDRDQPEDAPERTLLSHVTPWKRLFIFFAGPAVNLILGTVILFSMLVTIPVTSGTTTINKVNSCSTVGAVCGAEKAGLKAGDKIVALDGKEVKKFEDIHGRFQPGGSEVTYLRGGERHTVKVQASPEGKLGMDMALAENKRDAGEAVTVIGNLFTKNVEALSRLPQQVTNVAKAVFGHEKRSEESISSVVGVGKMYGETASSNKLTNDDKVTTFILYSALFNFGLGFANLLPLLPLDGGRMMIALVDAVKMGWAKTLRRKYSPVSNDWIGAWMVVSGTAVIGFMALVMIADIVAPIGG